MNAAQFSVRCTTGNGVLRIVVEGELDMATEPLLVEAVRTAVLDADVEHVVLDTTPLTFVDSSGLRALLLARDSVTSKELGISLAVVEGPVTRLLDAAGVTNWFTYE